ncbi:MAG: SIMPL domain-containing protein [Dehalococcoidia bacterium]|nr:SIMPL domain-containing protein [Dehalococcoidia bacterium]MDD5493059.1 SIMPL domain-containing protein [Dehalococcoidia bacterium]
MKKTVLLPAIILLTTLTLLFGQACTPEKSSPLPLSEVSKVLAASDLAALPGIIISQQNVGLWVNGLGKTTAAPDIVLLSIGVESQQRTVAEAQKEAVEAMGRIMNVLKNSGIADKDIQTTQFDIQQVTQWDDKQRTQIILGYSVTNTVQAKIRSVDKAGAVIDSAAESGGDLIRINGISFTVDDPTPFYKIAREKAVQYAMEKAKQISQVSGINLGKVLYVSEGSVYTTPMRQNYMKYSATDMAPAAPTPISAGELEFQVSVDMVYEIN